VLKPCSGLYGWKLVFYYKSPSLVCDTWNIWWGTGSSYSLGGFFPPACHHFIYAHLSVCMVCNIHDQPALVMLSDLTLGFTWMYSKKFGISLKTYWLLYIWRMYGFMVVINTFKRLCHLKYYILLLHEVQKMGYIKNIFKNCSI
jgi:hypothetical protein